MKLIKENNAYNSLVKQYICDSTADLETIESPEFGTMALVLTEFKIYVYDGAGEWRSESGVYDSTQVTENH